jgi:eukaryotic-like serine/threonine-protein kinase
MPARITLNVVEGKLQGQKFVFDERTACILGRSKDCQPQLPDDQDHKTISRQHCLLDINPPDIRVRDFGSLNGTHVNGTNIGQREKGMTPEEGARLKFTDFNLKHGDKLELGDTVFQVDVHVPAVCADCFAEIPEEQRSWLELAPGVARCGACRKKAEGAKISAPPIILARVCSQCGKDVSREMGENRQGQFICASCQADPYQLMRDLLQLAETVTGEMPAIKGYKIIRELGKGGMGAVYLVQHEKTGEQVALKVMLPQVPVDDRAKVAFGREIECTKALNHPHIVRLLDWGSSSGAFFFTLEYCEGGSVDRLMEKRGGSLPIDEAVGMTLQALAGLEYAHQAEVTVKLSDGTSKSVKGVVHRDLKPHNLFISKSGSSRVVKVADFGLAKGFDSAGLSGQTRTGALAGTLVFMPRQQIVNFKYAKPEVDVWAMAASLYYMITGAFPRDFPRGEDPCDVILRSSAVPIRKRNPKIPAKLAQVIDDALVDKPAITFKTATQLRQSLESAM